jgi:hypothetical protein
MRRICRSGDASTIWREGAQRDHRALAEKLGEPR